jgi:hypothetical protein
MATINGIPGKGHATERVMPGGLRHRTGTLEMLSYDAMRLSQLDDGDTSLLYTGAVLIDGVRRTETFPVVIISITQSTATPASVFFEQSGPPVADTRPG